MSEINNGDNKKWGSDLPLPNYVNTPSEIKPVYQTKFIATGSPDAWVNVDVQLFNHRKGKPDRFATRILYPAAAYEALQKENNSLKLGYKAKEFILQEAQKEVAKLRSFDADNKGLKECNSILTVENEALRKQVKGIAKGIQKHFELSDSDLAILMLNFENGYN